MFEIPKSIAVEQNKNCDHFSITHSPFSLAMFWIIGRGGWERKRGFVQFWMIFFAEIICNTIDFRNFADKFHEDCYFVIWLIINSKHTKKTILFLGFYWNFFEEKEELLIPNWGFWYLCDACKKKPIVVNEEEILNPIYFNNVFRNGKWNSYPIQPLSKFGKKQYDKVLYKKSPALVSREKNGYRWNHNTINKAKEVEYCETVFTYRLSKGFITSGDALWMACDILKNHQ